MHVRLIITLGRFGFGNASTAIRRAGVASLYLMQNKALTISEDEKYEHLVGDCRAILVEGLFRYRAELIEIHQQLGERIVDDPLYKRHGQNTQGKFMAKLAEDLGKSGRSIYYAVQYVQKIRTDKDFCTAVQNLGKIASWYKIKAMLPQGKSKAEESTADKQKGLRDLIESVLNNVWSHKADVMDALAVIMQAVEDYTKHGHKRGTEKSEG